MYSHFQGFLTYHKIIIFRQKTRLQIDFIGDFACEIINQVTFFQLSDVFLHAYIYIITMPALAYLNYL